MYYAQTFRIFRGTTMRKGWVSALSLLASSSAFAQQQEGEATLLRYLDLLLVDLPNLIFSSVNIAGTQTPLIVLWLVVAATVFTVYFGFINLRGMGHGLKLIRGHYTDPDSAGEVSHFQALATAVSGTVGLGNIGGVALAVSIGGAGATFWMILAGFLGMSSKFCECTLGVKYRIEHPDGSVSGGPMHYLSRGLKEKGMGGFGKVLAILFAICCLGGSFGGGNMFQVNQALEQLVVITGGENSLLSGRGWIFGIIMAFFTGIVIIGGIKGIARVTSKLVPVMAVLYISTALIIILMNLGAVPAAFSAIVQGAFAPDAMRGGLIGVLIVGFQRAAFSNEAGIGSAAIAHAAVKTREPVTEGLVALYEPFLDTIVICTMTALVIIITGGADAGGGAQGVQLTSGAFASVFAWFPYLLAIAVALFAFSTMLAWSYYGEKAWAYIFGEGKTKTNVYRVIFLLFAVMGSMLNLAVVQNFSDAMIFAMALPNVIGLYLLMPVVKRELKSYMARLKSGEIRSFR